jgi:acetylornithine deacetylase/succinyl-diaminopimelate desuccinylase-like protein
MSPRRTQRIDARQPEERRVGVWVQAPAEIGGRRVTPRSASCWARARSIRDETGEVHRLPSGPLHDAAEMARRVPTVMMFTPSTGGVSHNREEDTPEADLLVALRAYLALAEKALSWVAARDAAA